MSYNILSAKCVAVGCNVKYRTHSHIKYFRFPYVHKPKKITPEVKIRIAKWLEVAGITTVPNKAILLCQRHFSERQFYDGKYRTRLVRGSVPLYPTGPLNPITGDYAPIEGISKAVGTDDLPSGPQEEAIDVKDEESSPQPVASVEEDDRDSDFVAVDPSPSEVTPASMTEASVGCKSIPNLSLDCHPILDHDLEPDDYRSDGNPSRYDSESEDESYLQPINVINEERVSAVKSLQMLMNALASRIDSFTSGLLDGDGIVIAKHLAKSICEELDSFEKQFL